MSKYWEKFPSIESELEQVKEFMLQSVEDAIPIIKQPVEALINAGGKRLRPALVILGAKFGKYQSERIVPVAACVELLHTATLIHDDIIDEAKLRRGIQSVQSKHSKDVAVLVGDYIFAKVFDILAGDYPAEMLKNLSKSILQICSGELTQYSYRYTKDISLDKYIEIIAGKTAALFSMSLFAGAYEGGVKNYAMRNLTKTGYCIGMMFQIIDDCLDYNQDSDTLGKSAVNDIKQGYITLPMYYALQNDSDNKLNDLLFKSDLNEQNIHSIKQLVIDLGGVKQAYDKANEYKNDAKKAIKKLKRGKDRDTLDYIVESMMLRIS